MVNRLEGADGWKETNEEVMTVLLGRDDKVQINREQSKVLGRNRLSLACPAVYGCTGHRGGKH